jgi:hypothetical protein
VRVKYSFEKVCRSFLGEEMLLVKRGYFGFSSALRARSERECIESNPFKGSEWMYNAL